MDEEALEFGEINVVGYWIPLTAFDALELGDQDASFCCGLPVYACDFHG